MPEAAERPAGAKPGRSLTGFYVAVGVFMALALFGAWFWKAWTVWWFDAAEAKRRQAEAGRQLGLPVEKEVDLGDDVKLELVLIPAGRFRMGSPPEEPGRDGDETQHWVVITRPFYIGKHEVTQEQWEKVMGKNPSNFKGPKNPVENVSWDDCQEFLRKLNQLPSLTPTPLPKGEGRPHPSPLPKGEGAPSPSPSGRGVRGEGFRLPTEAEWEWACRAGTRTRFCSGDADADLADYAWFDANSGDTTHPVGVKKPNAWGLFDMHGNVWEWCGDWHDEYPKGWKPQADPAGPATGSTRALRGGSLDLNPNYCRSAYRFRFNPANWLYGLGFRVVVVPSGP